MKRQYFKCKLHSDIVMTASASTNILNEGLDYISGSKFLGIVAADIYKKDNQKSGEEIIDVLFSSKVRFSDAHIMIHGKRSLHVPASWFIMKGGSIGEEFYVHHLLEPKDFQNFTKEGKQPKQVRAGYFYPNDAYLKINSNAAIKSAYNRDTLRSEDKKMYGYHSLEKGTEWLFYVESDNDSYLSEISEILTRKKHQIGKSKSAQYGLINITASDYSEENSSSLKKDTISKEEEFYLYAESNLCFYDSYGRSSLNPIFDENKIKGQVKIIWDKSQIRTRLYQTWNRKRQNRNEDRQIIVKGSVIALKAITEIKKSELEKGVGSHLNEGFGKVIINPTFLDFPKKNALSKAKLKINPVQENINYFEENSAIDEIIFNQLNRAIDKKNMSIKIDEYVNEFRENNKSDFVGLNSSQWGMIRNYAKNTDNYKHFEELVFSESVGFTMNGQSKKDWEKHGRKETLENAAGEFNNPQSKLDFILKLSSIMAKLKN